MVFRMFPLLVALSALLYVAQTAQPLNEASASDLPDILFIDNVDSHPSLLSPQEAFMSSPQRNRVCTIALCARVCGALGFRWARCNANRVCICSR